MSGRHFVQDEDVLELTRDVIRKMGFTGVAVMDIRRNERDDRFHVIEINQRFGGSDIYYGKMGVNLGALWSDMALNRENIGEVFQPAVKITMRLGVYDRMIHKLGGPISESVSLLYSAAKRLFKANGR